jgi:DNA topoisomerase-3
MTKPPATAVQQMKQLVIAEKPAVAADIAKALGGFTKHGDYFESPTMLIAAAAGHLLESLRPKTWALETLPILPPQLEFVPKKRQEKRLAELVSLLGREDVTVVINACDAGREGELIFVEIMRHAGCTKPVQRLWLQSMTAAAIRRAFDHLRPAEAFRGLAEAAICRNIADWWIGINMTKALTGIMKRAGRYDLTSAGRVQTPTLMMVCDRDLEIARFTPQPYWLLTASFTLADGRVLVATWKARNHADAESNEDRGRRIASHDRAQSIVKKVAGHSATIASSVRVETQSPPPLFKLNDLLSDASSRFGFPADRTQSIAQALYEKKLITYPRTESQHLRPEDDLITVRERLEQIAAAVPALVTPARDALARGIDGTNKRVFDSAKVSDHFAIIPEQLPRDLPPLSEGEQKIFDLVLKRFVAAFLPPSETTVHTLTFTVAGETFEAVTRTIRVPGWRAVDGKTVETLPAMHDGTAAGTATAETTSVAMEERMTTPPRGHFTDGTLLKAMESAGKLVDDEEAQTAMRNSGLGTAATRTETIKKLLAERYLVRKGRELHATPKAMALKKVLGKLQLDVLTSPEMTGKWEARLAEIEAGTGATETFMTDIRRLAESLVAQTVSSPADLVLEDLPDVRMPNTNQPFVELLQDYATVDGSVRIPKFAWGRYLRPCELRTLLTDGVIGPLEGFYSQRTRKHYDASLRWDSQSHRYQLFFDKLQDPISEDHPQIGVCRHCGGAVHERQSRYVCVNATGDSPTCGFALKKLWCGREISHGEAVGLLDEGRTDVLEGFRGKNGRPFKAWLAVGPDGKAAFHFPEKRTKPSRKPNSSESDQKPDSRR